MTAICQLVGCLVRGERVPGRTTVQQSDARWRGDADVVRGERLRERGFRVATADLHEAYQGQLRASLVPPWEPGLDPGGTRSMLQASVTLPAGDLDEPDDGRVLVWSDLHLGDWMAPRLTPPEVVHDWGEVATAIRRSISRRRSSAGTRRVRRGRVRSCSP